jgi:hypothetical protein
VSSGAWTAIGTIALAAVTLAVIITTIAITIQDRRRADRREQYAQADAVQVLLGARQTGDPSDDSDDSDRRDGPLTKRLVAIVVNHGQYTITRLEARAGLSAAGNPSLIPLRVRPSRPGARNLDDSLRTIWSQLESLMPPAQQLTRWDQDIVFESDPVNDGQVAGAYPVVRWTDRWGNRWEHKRAEVRQTKDGEPWTP